MQRSRLHSDHRGVSIVRHLDRNHLWSKASAKAESYSSVPQLRYSAPLPPQPIPPQCCGLLLQLLILRTLLPQHVPLLTPQEEGRDHPAQLGGHRSAFGPLTLGGVTALTGSDELIVRPAGHGVGGGGEGA